jgi:hypothetical protein
MPRSTQLLPAVLLCTGTLVVLANQWVTTQVRRVAGLMLMQLR